MKITVVGVLAIVAVILALLFLSGYFNKGNNQDPEQNIV